MRSYLIEMDIDSVNVFVSAETEEEAGDKAYLKLTTILKEKGLDDMFKVYPVEAKELSVKETYRSLTN